MTMTMPRWVPIEPVSVLERRTDVFGGRVIMLWRREVVPASSLVEFVRGFIDGKPENPGNVRMERKRNDGDSRFGIGR